MSGTTKLQYSLANKNGCVIFLPPCVPQAQINLGDPDVMAASTTKLFPIGTLAWYPGIGKKYRYSKAGGALLGTKNLVVNANYVPDGTGYADHHGFYGHCAVDDVNVAYAAGVTEIKFTGTHDNAVNFYEGGYMIHFDGSTNSWYEESYVISGPTTAKTTPWHNVDVQLAEPIKNPIVAADGIEIWCNPYSNIVVATSSGYETYMGVAPLAIASGSYFWLQTAGPVFITPNGWSTLCPGYAADSRVCMSISGILTTQAAKGTGCQVIGTLLATTLATCADAFLNMDLDLGH